MNEFNASATPSEEMRRRLLYHAMTGNVTVASGFSVPDTFNPQTIEKKDREFYAQMRLVLASRERVEQFVQRLDLLDRAAYEALAENEESLRAARDELERLRDRAHEVTTPDGRRIKVYRDGAIVRDDDGMTVDPDIVTPPEIPATATTWAQRRDGGTVVTRLERERREILEYQDKLLQARNRAADPNLTEQQLEKDEQDVQRMPEAVRRRYERMEPGAAQTAPSIAPVDARASSRADTVPRPSQPFASAAAGTDSVPAPEDPDADFRNVVPNVSAPSPV